MRRVRLAFICAAGAALMLLFPLGSYGRPGVADDVWEGVWNTNFGQMTVKQSGASVQGVYTHDEGHIKGTLKGNVLSGRWSELPTRKGPNDAGPLEFTLDGSSFSGKWRYARDGSTWSDWNGTCSDGVCRTNGTAARTEVTIFLRGRDFRPAFAKVQAGGTIRFCNRSQTLWQVFTLHKINKFGPRRVNRGACIEQKMSNPTKLPIDLAIFDELKGAPKLSVVVVPKP